MQFDNIGDYLRELRKNMGYTLTGLATVSGVSHPYISQIENGKFNPSREILLKLSQPLGADYNHLCILAGYNDVETSKNEKISFAAQMIVDQIVDILDQARAQIQVKSVKEYIDFFEARLLSGAKGNDVTVAELKSDLWYPEGDGDSYKSTIGRRSDSSKIETLLDVLDNILDSEYRSTKEDHIRQKELENTEITKYFANNFITYNNHPLTNQDRQRILDMLKALFPEYQVPPNTDQRKI